MADIRRLNASRGRRPVFYWPMMATLSACCVLLPVVPAIVSFALGPVVVLSIGILAFRFQSEATRRARYSRKLFVVQLVSVLLTLLIFGLNLWLFTVTHSWLVPLIAAALQWVMVFMGGRAYEQRWSGALSTRV